MSDEFESIDQTGSHSSAKDLPNTTAVLVLGILSIVACWLYGFIGIILGIIALVLHKKENELSKTKRSAYETSFKNSNAGKICAIIGLSLSVLFLLYIIFLFSYLLESILLFPAAIPLFITLFYTLLHLSFKFKNGARNIIVLFSLTAFLILLNFILKHF
jgi:hypothetical protein